MTSPVVVEEFRAQHRRIEEHLSACDAVLERVEALHARLKEMRPLLLEHFDQKDAFYVKLRELCAHNGDLASSNIAKIFDDNMREMCIRDRLSTGPGRNAPGSAKGAAPSRANRPLSLARI